MELSEMLLEYGNLKEYTADGELLPDPNLIWNIDHMTSFILMELDAWHEHRALFEERVQDAVDVMKIVELLKQENVRFYIKSLFNVATYYIACTHALEKLVSQLNKLSTRYYKLRVKKPKLKIDEYFHAKTQFIRDKSFIHQDSEYIKNPMNKRVSMSWLPTVSHLSDKSPTCENYEFGSGKWYVVIDGSRKESDIDILITGFNEFATTAIEQINIRKDRVVNYYKEIEHAKKTRVKPSGT